MRRSTGLQTTLGPHDAIWPKSLNLLEGLRPSVMLCTYLICILNIHNSIYRKKQYIYVTNIFIHYTLYTMTLGNHNFDYGQIFPIWRFPKKKKEIEKKNKIKSKRKNASQFKKVTIWHKKAIVVLKPITARLDDVTSSSRLAGWLEACLVHQSQRSYVGVIKS